MRFVQGADHAGSAAQVNVVAGDSAVRNDAFDVTPARLITGIITERGVCEPSTQGLASQFPELASDGIKRRA